MFHEKTSQHAITKTILYICFAILTTIGISTRTTAHAACNGVDYSTAQNNFGGLHNAPNYPNIHAFAALKPDGSIKAWGDGSSGGLGAPTGTGYMQVSSNYYAFAALKSDGSIAVWGNSVNGGANAPVGTGFIKIYSSERAFAALKSDGSITAWGNSTYGGVGAPGGTGYVQIYSNIGAFAALKSDGSIKAWGNSDFGGTSAPVGTGFIKIYSSERAFAALKSDGSITAWGNSTYGGTGAPTDTGYTIPYGGNTCGSLTPLVTTSTLTTQSATNITPTSTTINAEITNTGGENPERIIEYGTATNTYTHSCTQGTGSIGTYSCTISNLTPGTTYYYKAKATNSAGTSYGDEMSFTTQSIPTEVTIPNPNDSALSNAVTSAYFSLNQGTVSNTQEIETNTTIKLTTTNTAVTLPPNTTITEENNNSFNFTQFQTTNTTNQTKQFTPSLAAVKIGVPNTRMEFSQPITLTLIVGEAYNNKTLNILYQEDGETTWNPQGTCIITDGKCTFQTDHATTYTVNGDGTISGAGQNDITTDVQDVLSMDCDQTGNTNDNIVEFGNLTPGTPVTASTTCTVTTNSDAGYTLAVKRNDTTSTMDKDGDEATDITDRTNWNNASPNATTWQTNDTGLAFTVYNTTATKNTAWWGTGTTVTDANNNYAGFPTSYTDIMQHTEYDETATTTQIGYKLDVPTTQKSGIYSGDITYQVVTAP